MPEAEAGAIVSEGDGSSDDASFKAKLAEAVSNASKEAVEAGLAASFASHTRGSFLDSAHPQMKSEHLGHDYEYTDAEFDEASVYVAASCVAHFGDAWSYFAQAASAIVAGELSIAKHLLYYSELRSAFSILARHGILVRSMKHVSVQAGGTVEIIGDKGTHEAVWLALKAWMKTSDARDFFLGGTKFGGISLLDWLDAEQGFTDATMVEIFRAIGYDLKSFSEDRVRRNSASYGATALKHAQPPNMDRWFSPELHRLWDLLEPSGSGGFDKIDAALSANVLVTARRRSKASMKPAKYLPHARALADNVGSEQPEANAQQLAALAATGSADDLLQYAFSPKLAEAKSNGELLAMVARSFLLARFSAAAAADLIAKSGVPVTQLDFWFAGNGAKLGLWPMTTPTSSIMDVLEDVNDSLDRLSTAESASDLATFLRAGSEGLTSATKFGLVTTWIRGDFDSELPVVA